jgi:23S rRNA G2069 N7-methylase RlmK/C1962 C5-methylase RlmI
MAEEATPQIAFAIREEPEAKPAITIHVNFGVFAGREATLAEIDRLAGWLLDRVGHVTIVSEVRHEIDRHSEAAVHQVRIEVPRSGNASEVEKLERWLVERAELWARLCVADRPAGPIPAGTAL